MCDRPLYTLRTSGVMSTNNKNEKSRHVTRFTNMAQNVKVQGSLDGCLSVLQGHADNYGVIYTAYFGASRSYTVFPRNMSSDRLPEVVLYFHWRHGYGEYDNSC